MIRQNIAFPFRTIPDELVTRSPWFRTDSNGEIGELGTAVEGWDYDAELKVSRTLRIDMKECLSETGLFKGNPTLAVIVTLQTGPGGYRWVGFREEFDATDAWSTEISIDVPSGNLAHELRLMTDIVLSRPGEAHARMAATRTGSRLWSDVQDVELEGKKARFPMEFLSFSKALAYLGAPSSRWYLHWRPDYLDASFVGSVVLYINQDDPEFTNLILGKDPVVLEWLRLDVIRQICSVLIESDDFVEHVQEGYYEGTLGAVVQKWFEIAFETMNINAVRLLYQMNRSGFEAALQSAFGGRSG